MSGVASVGVEVARLKKAANRMAAVLIRRGTRRLVCCCGTRIRAGALLSMRVMRCAREGGNAAQQRA